MGKHNWFKDNPIGKLSPTQEQIDKYEMPRGEVLTDTSAERKSLLEEYQSGIISKEELRDALLLLKENKQ